MGYWKSNPIRDREADNLPSRNTLHKLFELGLTDGEVDGRLIHRPRPVSWFKNERLWKIWNQENAGNEVAGSIGYKGRRQIAIWGRRAMIHRVIWKMVHDGLCPEQIDHKDGDPTNNRPGNLRAADSTINGQNRCRSRANTSGVTGVGFNKQLQKWKVWIGVNAKIKHLGYFVTFEEAVAARKKAEAEIGYSERHGCDPQSAA